MDSSPDLSLKLRRGSSDSRDNFYMDFAQGIDSDIEEVDNSALQRDPQQPPTPPLPVVDDIELVAIPSNIPPPPMMPLLHHAQPPPLPTLNESDDLPPTPPPHFSSTAMASPPVSPTSVLEMVPPPPLAAMSPPATRAALPPSPPIDTEDEGDDADVDETPDEDEADAEQSNANDGDDDEGDDDDDDDDDKSTPPPPLPPLPSNLSYVHGGGAHGTSLPAAPVSPTLTNSPSTSPSPPVTPPPRPKLSLEKISSPLADHVGAPLPPLTPPSESDQSQPNSPPPLPHHVQLSASPPPISGSPRSSEAVPEECPSTPPPEFEEEADLLAALAASVETASPEFHEDEVKGLVNQLSEEARSYNDDESTTITTPPSNGYSASSILAPPAEHLGELEDDVGMLLADIPPPAGMEDASEEDGEADDADDAHEADEADEPMGDEEPIAEGEKTPVSEDHTIDETPSEDQAKDETDDEAPGTPTAATPTSSTPKRSDSIGGGGSRGASHTASRSSSRAASRSGSVRGGSIASRAGSLAAMSVASAAESVVSGIQLPIAIVTSPPASIKSLRSQASIKSTQSKKMMSPPAMHSPPIVTSPPRVYSPPQISSPPMRKAEMTPVDDMTPSAPSAPSPPLSASPPPPSAPSPPPSPPSPSPKKINVLETSTGTDSLPSSTTTTTAAASDIAAVGAAGIAAVATYATAPSAAAAATTGSAAATSSAAQHAVRPHLSSHHHYHLPHQFQHPHHQNHHTHSHGSVPVPTPTVPASYTHTMLHEVRHVSAASGGASEESGAGSASYRRSSPPTPPALTEVISSSVVITSEMDSHVAISPVKSTARMRDSTSQHRVTIDESNLPHSSSISHHHAIDITSGGGGGSGDGDSGDGGSGNGSEPASPGSSSQQQLSNVGGEDRQTGHLALMYHSHQLTNYPVLPAIKRTHRPSFVYPPMPRVKAGDALATLFSALYGKLLVVMGIAFPMAEVISTYIPPSFYEVYYLYLYIGSMIFLLFMYATLLWGRPKIPIASPTKSTIKTRSTSASESLDESDTDSNSIRNKHIPPVIPSARRPSLLSPLGRQHHYGSFYLRMGAVAFGIGSMIYSGLEFGQYFELNPDTKCHNVLLALTPATRMAFIFIQMYFIFLNNEQIKVYRYKIIARFGLMHMIGTNLAVWLNVLIQETKHEILTFYNPENRTLRISHRIPGHSRGAAHAVIAPDPTAHLRVPRGLKGPYQIFECRRTNILGTLVQDASPFLFPCTIEYSLICAAILYVMWRSISRPQTPTPQRPDTISSPMKRSPHHYSVDCARAHKGLFVGILILVLTIISLILFFVLISRPDFVALAVTEVTICELLIYGTATIATLVGMIQMRHLQYDAYRSFTLDDILLVGAQTGSFLYNIFTVIAGHFTLRSDDMLVPINALASIVQTACQTMFILDASRRQAVSPEHMRKKPGREIVTFMLVVNLAMWAISTLEKSRAESHPIQLNFYGLWAWTIITHVSMPLAIFYRFHSTVCLCEIWKRAYKLKPTYM